MKRLINVRIPLFCALGLILGIISCHELLCGDFCFGVILGALLVAACVAAAVLKRGVKVFALLLCFAIVGFGIAELSYAQMEGDEVIAREVVLQGRVCDLGRNRETAGSVYYLENCVDVESDKAFRGRIEFVYYSHDEPLEVGEVVTVSATVYSTYPVKTSVDSFAIRNRIYYELLDAKLVGRVDGAMKFDEKVRRYVYETAMQYAPENGGIIYALLTGDRNAIDGDVVEDFQRAGTIHLLAVSGLHVGFVVAIICFALKRFRLKPLVECAIVSVPLVLYAYICGFSPSVVRAIVMTVCIYLSRAVFGRYDLLTSLSISALIVLFPTPYTLFDAGFQLSFLSVFGIATLHTPLMRLFLKRKINRFVKYLLNAFLLSLSCSLATLFTLAANFGQVPLLGVFVNLIAIPLISLVFVLSVVGMLPWVIHYLLVPADKILVALVWLNGQVANLSFATASFTALAVSAAIAAVLMFVVGGFVNLGKTVKSISCIVCALLLVATVVITVVPKRATNRVFVTYGYYGTVIAAVSEEGDAAIVGNFSDAYATAHAVQFLSQYRIDSCTLFVTEFAEAGEYAVKSALDNLPVEKVYTLTRQANDKVSEMIEGRGLQVVYQMPNSVAGTSIAVRSIYNGAFAAVNVSVGGIDVCFVTDASEVCALQYFGGADLYVLSASDVADYAQAGVVTFTRYQTNFAYNYGANKYGNFTIRQKDDRIIFNFS